MADTDPRSVLDRLDATRASLARLIVGRDLGAWVSEATGRRVQDVLAHLGQWDVYASMSLEAHADGGTFALPRPLDIDAVNERMFEEHRARDAADVVAFLHDSRVRLVTAAHAIPADRWSEPFRYPWGAEGGVAELLLDLDGHDRTHLAQIERALGEV